MPDERIEVIAHSGYKSEESPRVVLFRNKEIKVSEILSMWIEEEIEDRKRKRFFKIKGSDGHRYKIYYDEKAKEWYLLSRA